MTLDQLNPHQRSRISALPKDIEIAHALMEQGFVPRAEIIMAHKAPFKGPIAFKLQGTKVCLPPQVAAQIQVELINS